MAEKKKSCDRCHKRKEQCVGFPCQRCLRDGVNCEVRRSPKKIGRPKGPESGPARRKYSRHGCVPCRKQKKKCDEGMPACQLCIKKQRSCWYGSRIRESMDEEKLNDVNAMETDNVFVDEVVDPVVDPQESQDVFVPQKASFPNMGLNMLLAAASPVTTSYSQGEVASSSLFNAMEQSFFECLQSSKPLGSCDLESVKSSPSEWSTDSYQEQKLNLLGLCSLNTEQISVRETQLLCYFISDVSMLLFADKTTPRFLATVIPLCLADERVRYPILAIASSHRRYNAGVVDQELVRDAVKYRSEAQFCLARQNDDFYHDSENVLLSLSLVAINEIFEGTSLCWSSALEKGAEIIQARGGLTKMSKSSPLSIQLFCYLDHISSLSTCVTPHVDRSKINPYQNYNGNQVEDILNCKFGFRFGIDGELFKIMGNISTLASLRTDRYKTPEHEGNFNALANMIEMELQNWTPSLSGLSANFSIDGSLESGKSTISSYLLAVQWSSFLRLHQIMVGYDRKDPRVLACLSIILESLKSLQTDTEIETGLMFPLIMAGSVCAEADDREYILSRVRSIKKKLRFSYIGEFEKLLLAVWAQDTEAGHLVNWASIRYYQFPGLVMF